MKLSLKRTLLELARDAVVSKNLGLAQVYVSRFIDFVDARTRKNLLSSFEKKDVEFLLAVIDAQLERVMIARVRELRSSVVKK